VNDILLTLEQIDNEYKTARAVFQEQPNTRGIDGRTWTSFWESWLCRAQVRKVVEWVEKHEEWEDEYSYWFIRSEGIMAALKAAGGE